MSTTTNEYPKVLDSNIFLDKEIEYKQLNVDDFKGIETSKEILDIQEDVHLSDIAFNHIDLEEHNTVVINSSVGQGKSFFARKIAIEYYMAQTEEGKPKYTIIFAVPYKSLIEQYINHLKKDLLDKGIEELNIPDYTNITSSTERNTIHSDIQQASSERIHIITVNCLLANPGEDAFEQNYIKSNYLENLIRTAKEENRKVILVFDEIHDAIHNFKQNLIFYLWRFKTNSILHKTFILSATYNEASKVVIKYIAELTDKKLQILETKRIQKIKDLSNLYLHISNQNYYDFESDEFKELFKKIIDKHTTINILSYSRTICSNIATGKDSTYLRELLMNKYKDKINISIVKEHHLNEKQKERQGVPLSITYSEKYIPEKCNIGTTFRTGVSIEDEKSGYIIILPSAGAMSAYNRKGLGIFTDGITSLIQALARTRKKSDIYVIIPYSIQYIEDLQGYMYNPDSYIPKLLELKVFKSHLTRFNNPDYLYQSYSNQSTLISEKYNKTNSKILNEIKLVEELENNNLREFLPYLKYPTPDIFTLEDGERYLSSTYASFGKDLSAYMIWASFNNQFVNCKIAGLSYSKIKDKEEIENIQNYLFQFFIDNFKIYPNEITICDIDIFWSIFNRIFSLKEIYIKNKDNDWVLLSSNVLKKHIISFIQKFTKGNERMHRKYFKGTEITESSISFGDVEYTLGDYLLSSIRASIGYKSGADNRLTKNSRNSNLITAYIDLGEIRELFIQKLILPFDEEIGYINPEFKKYDNPFTTEEINLIINTFTLINGDYYFRVFKTNKIALNDTNKALGAIYNILKETFFITREFRGVNATGTRERILIVEEIIDIPVKRTGINLLYKYEYMKDKNYEKKFLDEMAIEEHNQLKWEDLDKMNQSTIVRDEEGNLIIQEEKNRN